MQGFIRVSMPQTDTNTYLPTLHNDKTLIDGHIIVQEIEKPTPTRSTRELLSPQLLDIKNSRNKGVC